MLFFAVLLYLYHRRKRGHGCLGNCAACPMGAGCPSAPRGKTDHSKGDISMMNFDIKAKIDEIAGKIKADPKLLKNFETEPVKTVESLLVVDLPDDKLQPLIEGIKAKLGGKIDLGNLLGGVKKLF